jgi:hypothetical protein
MDSDQLWLSLEDSLYFLLGFYRPRVSFLVSTTQICPVESPHPVTTDC